MEDLWKLERGTLRAESSSGTISMFEAMKAGEIKACWIVCTNPVATVSNRDNVIKALETAELVITQAVFLNTETNAYADVLLLEIARITPDLLQFVNERAKSDFLADLLKPERKAELKDWLWGRQIADVLHEFPIRCSATEWLAVLKPLQPRLYSIASSPKKQRGEVHLTISTVRYDRNGKRRGGVCSTFLADRAEETEVPIFVQKSPHFRPPQDKSRPVIMVGPGTGIAPFRGFLHERQATNATGKNLLFFGEQSEKSDFYYRDELEEMLATGVLHRLETAFSRDQQEKIYVQHRMLEQGAELWRWLQDGAYFYVCGDASRMTKDVDAALKQIVQTHGKLDAESAQSYVQKLISEKRYVKDVY